MATGWKGEHSLSYNMIMRAPEFDFQLSDMWPFLDGMVI